MPRPDAGLEVALEQRQRAFEQTQLVLSARERELADQTHLLHIAQSRITMVLGQIDAAQRPAVGMALPVGMLADLEHMLRWCEEQAQIQQGRLEAARVDADEARDHLAKAHQQVKALELVLQARRAERQEKVRRAELRDADETAARVHARKVASVR
jgi:flagellar biosynthesis chaperone FliJ